jgi:hypothetical protein
MIMLFIEIGIFPPFWILYNGFFFDKENISTLGYLQDSEIV